MKQEKLIDPRKRRMLLALPLLIIPFLTIAFWAMGGGASNASSMQERSTGLNLQLPHAQLKDDKGENKLSYYEQAQKDSLRWRDERESDPFFPSSLTDSIPNNAFSYRPYPLQTGDYKDPNEQKVYNKLEELNHHLESSVSNKRFNQDQNSRPSFENTSFDSGDIGRLEEMMKRASAPNTKDPEVEQLNSMMDRILDIQHPERVKQKLTRISEKDNGRVYTVSTTEDHYTVSLLDTNNSDSRGANAFYGVDNMEDYDGQNAIEAAIHETQSLVDGSIVKMRLLNDIVIDQTRIPKGSFVFGKGSLDGERLHIEINSLRKANTLFAVKLIAYDLDGMEGIHIPGAITRDVAKQSAGNSIQNIEMASIDPSFKAQATSAGISAAKTLLTKKAKLVKVMVKDGYKILLKEKL